MIIDLIKLRRQGDDESPFEFAFTPDQALMTIPDHTFGENAVIRGIIEVYEDKAFLKGTLTFTVIGKCARCLKDAEKTVIVGFDEEFRPAPCDLEDVNVYERDKIDVNALIAQLILTDMPYAIYCKDDCKGLCPTCGKDLNEGECGCDKN